jgi:hypothetical protein
LCGSFVVGARQMDAQQQELSSGTDDDQQRGQPPPPQVDAHARGRSSSDRPPGGPQLDETAAWRRRHVRMDDGDRSSSADDDVDADGDDDDYGDDDTHARRRGQPSLGSSAATLACSSLTNFGVQDCDWSRRTGAGGRMPMSCLATPVRRPAASTATTSDLEADDARLPMAHAAAASTRARSCQRAHANQAQTRRLGECNEFIDQPALNG